MTMRRLLDLKLFSWLSVVGWMGVIFFFSSLPAPRIPTVVPDFVPHLIEYAILGFLLFRAISLTKPKLPTLSLAEWAISLTVLYAISDEVHQLFVLTRTFSGQDLLIDSLAALLIVAALSYVRVRRSRK